MNLNEQDPDLQAWRDLLLRRTYDRVPRQNLIDAATVVRERDPAIKCYGVMLGPNRFPTTGGGMAFLLVVVDPDGAEYAAHLADAGHVKQVDGIQSLVVDVWRLPHMVVDPVDRASLAWMVGELAEEHGHTFAMAELIEPDTQATSLLYPGPGRVAKL